VSGHLRPRQVQTGLPSGGVVIWRKRPPFLGLARGIPFLGGERGTCRKSSRPSAGQEKEIIPTRGGTTIAESESKSPISVSRRGSTAPPPSRPFHPGSRSVAIARQNEVHG